MASTLIRGAEGIFTGLEGDRMRAKGSIRFEGGCITGIGDLAPLPGETVVDATGCVVYPGLVSTHQHLFQSVLKGVANGINLPLEGWLRTVAYTYWHKLDEEALAVAARIGLVELLLSGTTAAADHHYLFAESYRFDPADVIFSVARELGIRLVFCRGGATQTRSFDTPGMSDMPTESLDSMIRSVDACARKYNDPSGASFARVVFAPTTPPWAVHVSELKTIAAAARQMGLRMHTHLSETNEYVRFCMETYGKRPVTWIADHDWLGPDIWFAHLVHIDDDEIRLLSQSGTAMAHCPQSNCRLGSGIAPADRMAAMGGVVSLGVDGAASNESADMICEMHSAWHTHRATKGASAVDVEQVVRWATAGGARALAIDDIGTLEVGKQADLAVFALDEPRFFGLHDPLVGPVIGAGPATVRDLFIGGRRVVAGGQIPGFDLRKLKLDALKVVRQLMA